MDNLSLKLPPFSSLNSLCVCVCVCKSLCVCGCESVRIHYHDD